MRQPEITPVADGFRIDGDMVFASVTRLLILGERLFDDHAELVFDLVAVDHSDSAGLALLLEWQDRAQARGVQLRFRNLPESLINVAQLSNVDKMILGA